VLQSPVTWRNHHFGSNIGWGVLSLSSSDLIVTQFIVVLHFIDALCVVNFVSRDHCSQNQSVIFVVILISFMCYCGDCSGYIVIILPFLAFYLCSAYFLYLVYYKWYQSTFLGRNYGLIFFFRVEMYSDVFKPQRSIVTCINPWLRDSYMQEIQVVHKRTSVGHPCNPCWYPLEW
jgi:hypothetical protein